MIAADGQDGGVEWRSVGEDREVDRPRADVGDRRSQLALRLGDDRLRRGQRAGHQLVDLHAGSDDAFRQVLDGRGGRRDDVHLDAKTDGTHPERVLHALLLVDGEIPRQRVQDFAVRGDLDCPGNFRRAVDVLVRDLASMPADGDGARRVLALDVLTCDRDEGRVDLVARRSLGLLDRLGDRLHRLVDVHNDALAQPCRRNDALADDRERAVAADLADQRAHLRRADVDTHHDRFAFHVPFRSSLQGVQCPGRSTGSAVG